MKVIKFNQFKHLAHIHQWLSLRNLSPPTDLMPKMGYIVKDNRGGYTAAAFVRRIEGTSIGILDSLITNPTLTPSVRNEALDLLVSHLIKQCKAKGIKGLIAYSEDKNTLVRAATFGFKRLPHIVITLDLSGE